MKRLCTLLIALILLVSLTTAQVKVGGTVKTGGTGKVGVQTGGGGGSFPTTSVLDNFNRANEGPPMTGWTDSWRPSADGHQVSSNVAIGSTVNDNTSYWNTTIGPDLEVYGTIASGTTTYRGLSARLVSEGTSGVDGYELIVFGGNSIQLARWDDNVQTNVGATITQTISAGDSFGMKVVGSAFTIYYCLAGTGCGVGGAGWTQLSTPRTDSTYSAAGKLGIRTESTATWDDFGGGTL